MSQKYFRYVLHISDEIIWNINIKQKEVIPISKRQDKSFSDYISLGIATVGVGYIPFAPGTWGSIIGVLIYLVIRELETKIGLDYIDTNVQINVINNWIHLLNAGLLLFLCLIGIRAATRATILFKVKDPQKVVIDEVMGQLITFLFVPFAISWHLVLGGFLLFRLFDMWKPYPIDSLEDLPGGLGVCLDDILAGIYAGICLLFFYTVGISFL